MNVVVTGGRNFYDTAKLKAVLDTVLGWNDDQPFILINGGAPGADQLSTVWAKERGVKWVEVPIAKTPEERVAMNAGFDWVSQGKAAGPLRNQFMLDQYKPKQAVVFAGGNGTKDMLVRLFEARVNCWVVGA